MTHDAAGTEVREPDAPPDGDGTAAPPTPAGRRRLRRAAAIAIVGFALFVVIALVVTLPFADEFDAAVLRLLRSGDDPRLTRGGTGIGEVARDITALGGTVVLVLVVGLVATYLAVDRRMRDAIAVVVASGGGVLLGVLLKVIFGRERPSVVPHLVSAHSGSFPSGHSMLSAIVYCTLGALLARFAKRRGTQVLPIAAAILITLLVGVSRLVLGVHYPTDVLAGWSAGAAWAGCAWIAVDRLARQGKVEGRASGPQPPAA